MASDVEVASMALGLIGDKAISSLFPPDDTPRAQAAALWFPTARDATLRVHPWNFAVARITLAAHTVAPDWGPARRYLLPNGTLRVLEVENESRSFNKWRVEQGYIVTDLESPISIRYIERIVDAESWDPLFVKAMTHGLASLLAQKIREDRLLARVQTQLFLQAINDARSFDSFERTDEDTDDWNDFSWLVARLGNGTPP